MTKVPALTQILTMGLLLALSSNLPAFQAPEQFAPPRPINAMPSAVKPMAYPHSVPATQLGNNWYRQSPMPMAYAPGYMPPQIAGRQLPPNMPPKVPVVPPGINTLSVGVLPPIVNVADERRRQRVELQEKRLIRIGSTKLEPIPTGSDSAEKKATGIARVQLTEEPPASPSVYRAELTPPLDMRSNFAGSSVLQPKHPSGSASSKTNAVPIVAAKTQSDAVSILEYDQLKRSGTLFSSTPTPKTEEQTPGPSSVGATTGAKSTKIAEVPNNLRTPPTNSRKSQTSDRNAKSRSSSLLEFFALAKPGARRTDGRQSVSQNPSPNSAHASTRQQSQNGYQNRVANRPGGVGIDKQRFVIDDPALRKPDRQPPRVAPETWTAEGQVTR